jgi:hypothetical protein
MMAMETPRPVRGSFLNDSISEGQWLTDWNASRACWDGRLWNWGDMPRDIQEALFETAMKGQTAEREELCPLRPSPPNLASTEARS